MEVSLKAYKALGPGSYYRYLVLGSYHRHLIVIVIYGIEIIWQLAAKQRGVNPTIFLYRELALVLQ